METEKTEMLQNIFELGTTLVKETMVPAKKIIAVEVSTPIKKVLDIFSKHQFTRLPVYQEKDDNVIGIVHLKDIFTHLLKHEEKTLQELVRPVMFVPENVKVNQLLKEFREQHTCPWPWLSTSMAASLACDAGKHARRNCGWN